MNSLRKKSPKNEIKERVKEAEKRKKYFEEYLKKLQESYNQRKISYSFYLKVFHGNFGGKTILQWIKYYDYCINKYKNFIKEQNKKSIGKFFSIFMIFSIIFLITIFLFSHTNLLKTNFTGFVIEKENESISSINKTLSSENISQVQNKTSPNNTSINSKNENLSTENKTLFENQKSIQNQTKTINKTSSTIENQTISNKTTSNQTKTINKTSSTIENQTISNKTTSNQTNIEKNITKKIPINLTESKIIDEVLIQHQAVIGQPVKWVKKIEIDKEGEVIVKVPEDAEKIGIKKLKKENQSENYEKSETAIFSVTGGIIGTNDKQKTIIEKLFNFLKKVFKNITGKVIDSELRNEKEIKISDDSTAYEIEYETPAPYAKEKELQNGKEVKIIGPETIHYENVLAFTNLNENLNIINPSQIKIHWIENDSYIPTENIMDTDSNGIYDYIEWIVPHLSEQTFEIIIEITKAEHLDENKNFISDIYNEVYQLDNIWSETIPENHYIRVTFEKELDNTKDITLFPKVISGNPKIEVYEKDKTEKITELTNIISNEYNKIYLTNLQGQQDTFDLKIVNGNMKFDHIIDPVSSSTPWWTENGKETFSSSTNAVDISKEVDTNKAFILLSVMSTSSSYDDPNEIGVYPEWVNGTRFNIQREASSGDVTVVWQVVEGNDIYVQNGTHDYSATSSSDSQSADITIDSVDVDNTVVFMSWGSCEGTSGGSHTNEIFWTGNVTSATNLHIQRDDSYYCTGTVAYFVVEFNDGSTIQSGEIPSVGTSATYANLENAINMSDTWLYFSTGLDTSANGLDDTGVRATHYSTTAFSFERYSTGGTARAQWYAISTPGAVVQYDEQTSATSNDITISEVVVNRSISLHSYEDSGGGTTFDNTLGTSQITTSTNLHYERGSTSQTQNVYWHVVQFPEGAAGPSDTEYPQFSNYWDDNATLTGSGTGHFNVTITSTNGTVFLEINNTNITATNLTANVYNASYDFALNGTYSYKWHSWGNGTNNNYNVSDTRSYTVNANSPPTTPTNIQCNGNDNCNISVDNSVVLNASGSTDADSDAITYFIEASLQNTTTIQNTTDVSMTASGGAGGSGDVSSSISQSSDDAEEDSDGGMSLTSSDLELTYDSSNQIIGMRFQNVNVPQGATITSAVLGFICDETSSGDGTVYVYCEDTDDASETFTDSTSYNISGRTFTSNYATWEFQEGWTSTGTNYNSTDISAPIQEVINREGWTANNDIVVMINSTITSNDNSRIAESYDGTDVATLYISYSLSGASNETNTTATTYNDVNSDYDSISNITIKIEVDSYDPRASVSQSTNDPDLWLEIYNSSDWIEIGAFDLPSTYTGTGLQTNNENFSLTTTNSAILTAWQTSANQDIRIKGIYMDHNSSLPDEINYTNVWVTINRVGWTEIGNHSESTTLTWNTTDLDEQTCIDLRARAIDLAGGNSYSSYFTKGACLNISHGEEENTAPKITAVSSIPSTNPIESSSTAITFYATMYDADGVADLNDSSVNASFSKAGETTRYNSSCVWIEDLDANSANYSCTIDMWYWDGNGEWNIIIYGEDNNQESATNDTTTFTYNLLTAMVISPKQINFNIITGIANQTADYPTIINNTGNNNITSGHINITGLNLYGESDNNFFINVANFSVGINTGGTPPAECDGTALVNGTSIGIANSILPRGNLSQGEGTAQEQLYYCIKSINGIPSQTYSTSATGSWTIRILLALVTPASKRKRKKKIKDNDQLIKELNLIIEKLKKKHKVTKTQILETINSKPKIPITIFSKKLGALESLVKYMKENLNMTYKEIAVELKRNERTIWTAYKKAKEKQEVIIKVKKSDTKLPISIFKNEKLTILESTIIHLKKKQMKFSEIAGLLNRDQRNIWTIYSRAKKKINKE